MKNNGGRWQKHTTNRLIRYFCSQQPLIMKERVVGGTDSVFVLFLSLTLQSSWSKYHWDKLDQVNDGNYLFQITFLTYAPFCLLLSANVSSPYHSCTELSSCVTQIHFYFLELKLSLYFAIEWLSFHRLPSIEAVIIFRQWTTVEWPNMTSLVLCAPVWTAHFCPTWKIQSFSNLQKYWLQFCHFQTTNFELFH